MNLTDYIKGNRKGSEANRLEKDAMTDPFLYDALEGYDAVPEAGLPQIDRMRNAVAEKSRSRKNGKFVLLGAAAGLILCLTAGLYYFAEKNNDSDRLAINVDAKEKTEKKYRKPGHNDAFADDKNAYRTPDENNAIGENRRNESTVDKSLRNDRPVKQSPPRTQETKKTSNDISSEAIVHNDDLKSDMMQLVEIGIISETIDSETITISESKDSEKILIRGKIVNETGEPAEFKPDSNETLTITLNEIADKLEEVVVEAYDRSSKKSAEKSAASEKNAKTVENTKTKHDSRPLQGMSKYIKYLKNNIILPDDKKCRGKVTLTFTVDLSGSPVDIKIKNGLCPEADTEAVRLVATGPKWTAQSDTIVLTVNFED